MGSANVVVNVDASGSSVEGNSDQAAQLGKMLGAAVQAELIKQSVLAVSSQADGYFPVNYSEVWTAKEQRTKRSQGAILTATKPD